MLAGIFLGSLAMLNIIGITRFLQIGPLSLAVGVLPYPLTFLCTDLISELYGRKRAALVVWVGTEAHVAQVQELYQRLERGDLDLIKAAPLIGAAKAPSVWYRNLVSAPVVVVLLLLSVAGSILPYLDRNFEILPLLN